MTYEARLEIGVDSRGAERDVNRLDDSLEKVERSGNRADKSTRKFGKGAKSTAVDLNKLRVAAVGLVGAIGGVAAIRSIVRASDTYTELRSQLRLVTESQEELNQVYEQTFRLAQDTRQDLEGTVNLYARLARSTDTLKLSNEDLLTITRAVNQSFVISGASAEEAAGAVRQLSQGMASGTLRGEELNSVMENSPRLARAIADQLGVTIGELRQLGADGEITAEAISTALIGAADDIGREFQTMERTVGQAMQQLRNDLTNTFGRTDTSEFVTAIDELREIVTDPGFQQSMVTLASGVAKLTGVMAKGTSAVVDFTKWLGEELAATIHGVAGDDLVRLSDRMADINEEIERLQGARGPEWGELDRVKELKAELAGLQAQYDAALNSQVKLAAGPVELDPITVSAGASPDSGGASPKVKAAQEESAELDMLVDAAWARTEQYRLAHEMDVQHAQEKADRIKEIEQERVDSQKQIGSELLTFTQQQLSITTNMLATAGKKNSDLYKTLVAIQRAAAIPSMIIATEDAATKALAWGGGGPAGIALSNTVRSLGYASVGIAGAQVFQGSFNGGGYTGNGIRAGGVDGMGGFPAILHPNETVVDHSKGQSMGANVTVNMVEDASKAGQVQQRQTDEGTLITAFVANIRNDGDAARVLQQTYGMKRVGT